METPPSWRLIDSSFVSCGETERCLLNMNEKRYHRKEATKNFNFVLSFICIVFIHFHPLLYHVFFHLFFMFNFKGPLFPLFSLFPLFPVLLLLPSSPHSFISESPSSSFSFFFPFSLSTSFKTQSKNACIGFPDANAAAPSSGLN